MTAALPGTVVVVPLGDLAGPVVRRLAGEGATVVLVGDGPEAGALAAQVEAARGAGAGRAAVFAGADLDGLVEFLSELFRPASSGGTTSA